ncbi:MAG: hypothetical protein STHCBS139747_000511 [Sporothrix thermara]
MAQPTGVPAPAAAAPVAAGKVPTSTTPAKTAIDDLFLADPPPMDPVWVQHEKDENLPYPRPVVPPLERQPIYAAECRELNASMIAPGARDHHLAVGVNVRQLGVPSTLDGYEVPLLEYSLAADETAHPDYAVLYVHGGGLHIGEADSEELPCRRILKDAQLPSKVDGRAASLVVYSVGYRTMPQHPASTCVSDAIDAYRFVRAAHPDPAATKLLIVGSSSGGELTAFVSQEAAKDAAKLSSSLSVPQLGIQGVVLRCPVTSDAFNGNEYVPAALRPLHTSAANAKFATTLLGRMNRLVPRDGLPYMPLEAPAELLAVQPRHWIQVCTNDMLYSDGICYAKALETAGAEVRIDVVVGWPHTFWLKTPWMERALEADEAMLRGLAWVAGGP